MCNQVYYFFYQQWLREKWELSLPALPSLPLTEYDVFVTTSNLRGAGTDASVYLEIVGDDGRTLRKTLDSPGHDPFERGNTDSFRILGRNVGKMTAVVVGHDNKGFCPDWHLKQIKVQPVNPLSRAMKIITVVSLKFVCAKHLLKSASTENGFSSYC